MKEVYRSKHFVITESDAHTEIGMPYKDVTIERLPDGAKIRMPSDIGGIDCILKAFMATVFDIKHF